MSMHTRVRLVILGTFLFTIFVMNECKKLDGYKFPVYSTPFCPRNESEWNKRSSALNCNGTNGYTCLPNEKLTELLEFCYTQPWILIEEGYCLYLERKGSYVDSFSCLHFIQGCHNTSYQSIRIYEHPACISIGNGCFLAEQSCKSSPNTTHRPENDKDDWLWVVILIGILVFILSFSSLMQYLYRKKRGPDMKNADEEAPLINEGLFGDAKAGIDDPPPPDPITETMTPSTTTPRPDPTTETSTLSTTTASPAPITETSTPSTTRPPSDPITMTATPSTSTPTTVAPLQQISQSNQEPEIIIGVCVSVFGLISLLVTVGVVTKICNDKKRRKQYQDACDTSRF